MFPGFRPFLDRSVAVQAVSDLRNVSRADVKAITGDLPRKWDVKPAALDALVELILSRAVYVADTIVDRLWPQGVLFEEDESEPQQ